MQEDDSQYAFRAHTGKLVEKNEFMIFLVLIIGQYST